MHQQHNVFAKHDVYKSVFLGPMHDEGLLASSSNALVVPMHASGDGIVLVVVCRSRVDIPDLFITSVPNRR
jgi:hypothetical protein